jgi:hypothetical protein
MGIIAGAFAAAGFCEGDASSFAPTYPLAKFGREYAVRKAGVVLGGFN